MPCPVIDKGSNLVYSADMNDKNFPEVGVRAVVKDYDEFMEKMAGATHAMTILSVNIINVTRNMALLVEQIEALKSVLGS